jgi:hypothetical protein
MDSPLGAPGARPGLGGSLLVQLCIEGCIYLVSRIRINPFYYISPLLPAAAVTSRLRCDLRSHRSSRQGDPVTRAAVYDIHSGSISYSTSVPYSRADSESTAMPSAAGPRGASHVHAMLPKQAGARDNCSSLSLVATTPYHMG